MLWQKGSDLTARDLGCPRVWHLQDTCREELLLQAAVTSVHTISCYPTWNYRREISACSPAQDGRQHDGEVGATSSQHQSPTQIKASLVVCTAQTICPAAQGCPNHKPLFGQLFCTTFQRCVDSSFKSSLLITLDVSGHLGSSFPSIPTHEMHLLTSSEEVPSSGSFCQLLCTLLYADSTEHLLNLPQLKLQNVTETFAEGFRDKNHIRSGGALPSDGDFPSLGVLHMELLLA